MFDEAEPPEDRDDWGPEHYEEYWCADDIENVDGSSEIDDDDADPVVEDYPPSAAALGSVQSPSQAVSCEPTRTILNSRSFGAPFSDVDLFVDASGFYVYILWCDNKRTWADVTKSLLNNYSVTWRVMGSATQPAKNGHRYDHYLRLTRDWVDGIAGEDYAPLLGFLRALAAGLSRMTASEAQVAAMKDRRGDATVTPSSTLVDAADVQTVAEAAIPKNRIFELEKDNRALAERNGELERQNALLAKGVEAFRFLAKKALSDGYREGVYHKDLAHLFEADNEKLRTQNELLQKTGGGVRNNADAGKPPMERAAKGVVSLDDVLKAAFWNVNFLRGSLDVIVHELQNPIFVIHKISEIERKGGAGSVGATSAVKGRPGWWETRFSAGSGNREGRLYFRKSETGVFDVLVGKKSSQPSDIRSLKKV